MQADAILIVDDEPQIRRVVRNALAADGTRLIEAATGAEAIDMAAAELPKLVILDLGLPDMSGEAVCREIRSWSARNLAGELAGFGRSVEVRDPPEVGEELARIGDELRERYGVRRTGATTSHDGSPLATPRRRPNPSRPTPEAGSA